MFDDTKPCSQAPLQVDLDGYEGPVPEFLAQEPVQREVARRFRIFLRTFTDDKGEEVYQSKLRNLGSGVWDSARKHANMHLNRVSCRRQQAVARRRL